MERIGIILKEKRELLKVSRQDIAYATGLTMRCLSRIESGQCADLYFETVARICDVLDLSLDALVAELQVRLDVY